MLVPVREPTGKIENVPAVPIHANCALCGADSDKGKIERIKDGDGSPYPVITEQGQFKIEEVVFHVR